MALIRGRVFYKASRARGGGGGGGEEGGAEEENGGREIPERK